MEGDNLHFKPIQSILNLFKPNNLSRDEVAEPQLTAFDNSRKPVTKRLLKNMCLKFKRSKFGFQKMLSSFEIIV